MNLIDSFCNFDPLIDKSYTSYDILLLMSINTTLKSDESGFKQNSNLKINFELQKKRRRILFWIFLSNTIYINLSILSIKSWMNIMITWVFSSLLQLLLSKLKTNHKLHLSFHVLSLSFLFRLLFFFFNFNFLWFVSLLHE